MIELVVGGARSGKSRYALNSALARPGPHVFIATAEAGDEEMAGRIGRHKLDRGPQWAVIEEPLRLAQAVNNLEAGNVAVIDCLTLWLSNWLCNEDTASWHEQKAAFIQSLHDTGADIILVSNETGLGVIPVGELSRKFVDESGWLHQELAKLADHVVMVMLGIPQVLKS